jgi:nucleotide-binding universal stress UspA family protein
VRGAAGADLAAPAEALLQAAGVDYELEVAGGEPATMILELAENYGCGLIVLGGEGEIIDEVIAQSTLPVTVVPVPEPD